MHNYELEHSPSYCPFCGADHEPSESWHENSAPWFKCFNCDTEFKYQRKGSIANESKKVA